MTLLVYANCQADEMVSFLQRSDPLLDLPDIERVFLGAIHDFVAIHGQAEAEARLRRVTIVWEQVSQANPDERALMRTLVPPTARWLRFPALSCSTLWPFASSDNRPSGDDRYPYSDMLAMRVWREMGGADNRLAGLGDDILFDRYMELSTAKMPDLDRMLELDLQSWKQRDLDADVPIADFLLQRLAQVRLFYTVGRASWLPTAEILQGLIELTIADPNGRRSSLKQIQLMGANYTGNDTISMPINPTVAVRLGLDWYRPDDLHNWHSYELDFRSFVIRCTRLADQR